jgi:NAD(P)-dependent dehydrogenase (short-subunit alcohol dehydrogenase family)
MTGSSSAVRNRSLQGKVAIVTGGASGIGEATARLFAEHGTRMVVIADIQDQLGHQVATSIGIDKCNYIRCDVADEEQVKAMVESTVQKHGQLDIMFSNAGILSPSEQTVLELDFPQFDRLFAVNVRGMALCVKHAARAMVERRVKGGSIVCTGSVVGSRGVSMSSDYCMSKHAIVGLVRSASEQLGVHGIRVNCVSPNGLATPLTMQALGRSAEEVEKRYEKLRILKGGALKVKHVADAVLFLVCNEFVTGHDLAVDGGFVSPIHGSML